MTPIDRAREAAVEAVRWSDAEYNPEYIVRDAIAAYEAALSAEGKMIVSCDSAERLVAANQVMRRMIEDVEARGVDLSAYADELNSLAAMFEADAMIAAASAYNMHEQQRDKPDEG